MHCTVNAPQLDPSGKGQAKKDEGNGEGQQQTKNEESQGCGSAVHPARAHAHVAAPGPLIPRLGLVQEIAVRRPGPGNYKEIEIAATAGNPARRRPWPARCS